MKAKELKELGVEELKAKLAEQRQELFNLRFQHTTAQLEKTSSIPAARKNIARILTCLLYTSPSPRDGLLSRMPSSA